MTDEDQRQATLMEKGLPVSTPTVAVLADEIMEYVKTGKHPNPTINYPDIVEYRGERIAGGLI